MSIHPRPLPAPPIRRARPYQRLFDHPRQLARAGAMAAVVLHAARRADETPSRDPKRARAEALIRDHADRIARHLLPED
ncbi:MAG: hypothetical protein JXQ79_06060 [Rhodobacteraceae bacterium]|nr:hypothetical protein [Paracoccaceae bacterium]